jgi:hypothetical protein
MRDRPPLPRAVAVLLWLAAFQGCGQKPDDRPIELRNAAGQAAALNQDPGGADRDRLLKERAREPIYAGRPEVRTPHPDAQWSGRRPLGLFLRWGISSVHGGIDISGAMIRTFTKTPAGYEMTLPDGAAWDPLDTVIRVRRV